MKNITKAILGLAVALALVSVAATTVSAETYQPTNSSDLPISEEVTVNNDTQEIRVMAENVTGTLDVTVYSVNKTGAGALTEETTGTLSTNASAGTYTDTFTFSSWVDGTDKYSVRINGSSSDSAEMVDVAKLQLVSGGGGGGDGASGMVNELTADLSQTQKLGIGGGVLAILGIAFVVLRD